MKELESFFFYYNPDEDLQKFVIGGLIENKHVTFRVWNKTRELDLHINDETLSKEHPDKYKTLFKISFDELKKIGREFEIIDFSFLKDLFTDKINLGKLIKNDCIVQPLSDNIVKTEVFFKMRKNGRHSKFKKNIPQKDVEDLIMWPEQVIEFDEGAFIVFKIKKGIPILNGYVYRHPIHKGTSKFIFLSRKRMNKLQREILLLFFKAIDKAEFENKNEVMAFLRGILVKRFPLVKWEH